MLLRTFRSRLKALHPIIVLGLAWVAAVDLRAPLLALGPVLPLIIADLQLSSTLAGALGGLPLLLMALVSFPAGLLADRIGPRWVLVITQLAIALAGGARGLAQSGLHLLAASVVLGAAVGTAQPALAQVARFVLPGRPALATAIYANGLVVGGLAAAALSVPVLLPLAGPLSWRGVMLLWSLLGLAAALGWALVSIPDRGAERAHRVQRLPLAQVLAIPGLLPLAIAFAAQSATFYAMSTWLPAYFVQLGWTLEDASALLVAASAVSIVAGFAAPALGEAWGGPRRPMIAGGVLTLLSETALLLFPSGAILWSAALGVGTTFAFIFGLAAPAELAPRQQVGTAAGALLTLGYTGSLLGPVGFGALRDLTGGFEASMAFLIALGVVLVVSSAAVPGGKR